MSRSFVHQRSAPSPFACQRKRKLTNHLAEILQSKENSTICSLLLWPKQQLGRRPGRTAYVRRKCFSTPARWFVAVAERWHHSWNELICHLVCNSQLRERKRILNSKSESVISETWSKFHPGKQFVHSPNGPRPNPGRFKNYSFCSTSTSSQSSIATLHLPTFFLLWVLCCCFSWSLLNLWARDAQVVRRNVEESW